MSFLLKTVCLVTPLIGGFLGGVSTQGAINTWYKKINKPWWNPPNWAFGPVWTTLYLMMGYSSYLVLEQYHQPLWDVLVQPPVYWYLGQLGLNWMWSPLFFNKHWGLALLNILAMWGSIYKTIGLFSPISPLASFLLYPYLIWVSLATTLNVYIWWFNNPKEKYE